MKLASVLIKIHSWDGTNILSVPDSLSHRKVRPGAAVTLSWCKHRKRMTIVATLGRIPKANATSLLNPWFVSEPWPPRTHLVMV